MREQQFNEYGSPMTAEEIAQADKEDAQWLSEIRKKPIFKDQALWDEVAARRLAARGN